MCKLREAAEQALEALCDFDYDKRIVAIEALHEVLENVMSKIIEQKAIADKVLNMLECIDPYCIVAGGAPRDWYLNKEAKDIDVFIHVPKRGKSVLKLMLESAGFKITTEKSGESLPENYKLNPHLITVFDIAGFSTPVQIIAMDVPTFNSVVNKFPLSICKAWYKKGDIHIHKQFLLSVKHKVIFNTGEKFYSDENRYITKILSKFSDYKHFTSESEAMRSLLYKEICK